MPVEICEHRQEIGANGNLIGQDNYMTIVYSEKSGVYRTRIHLDVSYRPRSYGVLEKWSNEYGWLEMYTIIDKDFINGVSDMEETSDYLHSLISVFEE